MGLLNSVFRRKKDPAVVQSFPTHDISLTLTTIGREKAESMQLKSPYFEVLTSLLEAGGTANMTELSEKTGWPVKKVEGVAKSLARSGYLKQVKV